MKKRSKNLSPSEIRTIRERAGLSQARLAAFLGTSVVSVSRWEMARSNPNARKPSGPVLEMLWAIRKRLNELEREHLEKKKSEIMRITKATALVGGAFLLLSILFGRD